MDEQNPRLGGEYLSGRSDERTRALDPGAGERSSTARSAAATSPHESPGSTSRTAYADEAAPRRSTVEGVEPRTRELRSEIEHTRGELTETVNAIQERLRPSNIVAGAKESVKAVARERAHDVAQSEPVQYIRANPIATTMIGIGIAGAAMLAFGGREPERSYRRRQNARRDWRNTEYDDTRSGYAGGSSRSEMQGYSGIETADQYTPDLSRRAYGSDAAEVYGGRTQREQHQTRMYRPARYRSLSSGGRDYLERTWNENPLVIGAASVVIGALVGLAVPESERENELMGEARDSVVDTVQDSVRDKVNQVQQAASTAVNTVKDAAGSAIGIAETNNTSNTPEGNTNGSADRGRS